MTRRMAIIGGVLFIAIASVFCTVAVWVHRGGVKNPELATAVPTVQERGVPSTNTEWKNRARPDVSTKTMNQEQRVDLGANIDDVLSDKLGEIDDLHRWLEACTSIKERMDRFDLLYHDKILSWPAYSEFSRNDKPKLRDEYVKDGQYDIEAAIRSGYRLIEEFWKNGHLGNPSAFEYLYRARALAEIALEIDPQREDAYVLAEQAILSYAIIRSPYLKKTGTHYNEPLYEMNLRTSNELRDISLRHFVNIISKKDIEKVTAYDLAVANHVLQVVSEIDYDEYESDKQIAPFFGIGQSMDGKQADIAIRRKCLTWMRSVVLGRHWDNYMDFMDAYMKALDNGDPELPVFPIYGNNIQLVSDDAWHAWLVFGHRYDGLMVKYLGEPAFIAGHECPVMTEKDKALSKKVSEILGNRKWRDTVSGLSGEVRTSR